MELFIALFGTIYYLLKFANYKNETKVIRERYDREANNDEQVKRKWVRLVTNASLETELYNKVIRRDPEVLYEISSSGVYCPVVGTFYDKTWALRILMASRGFLTKEDAEYGVKVYFGNTKETIEWNYEHLKDTLMYLDTMLRNRGVCHDMFFQSVNKYYPFPLNFSPAPGSVTSVGRIVWRPMISSAEMCRSKEILAMAGIN